MSKKFSPLQIREFWTEQARSHGVSPCASWSDVGVIELETREISKYLEQADSVLDAGCANGFTTLELASRRNVRIHGIDYIPEMIEQAKFRLAAAPASVAGRVSFDVGDIRDLSAPDRSYDKVVVIRVLINIMDQKTRLQALRQCSRVLRPGGLLLLSEATVQGWNSLNRFRREWGLPDIPMPLFNSYLDEDSVAEAAAGCSLELREVSNFASTYYVGTRVLKPLAARLAPNGVDVSDPKMEWNRWFAQLPAAGDYGTQKLFVLRRK